MWLRRLSHRWVDGHVVGMIFVWLKRLSFGWDDCHVAALTVIWLNDCHVVNTTVTWLRRLSPDWDDCRLFRETTFTLLSWDTSSGGHRCSKCLVLGQCNYCLLGITRLPKCCGIRNHPNLACIVFCDADSRPKLATVGGARAVPCRSWRPRSTFFGAFAQRFFATTLLFTGSVRLNRHFVSKPRRLRSQPATSNGPGHPPDTDHDDDDNGDDLDELKRAKNNVVWKSTAQTSEEATTESGGRSSTGDRQARAGSVRLDGAARRRVEVDPWRGEHVDPVGAQRVLSYAMVAASGTGWFSWWGCGRDRSLPAASTTERRVNCRRRPQLRQQ